MLLKFLTKTDVKKNLTISVIGTGLGQLIHLGTTPVISRIYSPETFGFFSLYMSFLGIFTSISLMKLDLAIIACEDNEVRLIKRVLSFLASVTTVLSASIAITLLFLENPQYKIFIFLAVTMPIVGRFWTHRAILNKAAIFKKLSLGKIFENSTNGILAIGLGLANLKDIGLFAGKIGGLAVTWLYFRFTSAKLYKEQSSESLKEIFVKYSNYPKFSFPAELVAHLNLNTAIFLFTYYFSSVEVGLIGLTTRVMAVPANFVSISFFDVFKQKAMSDYKETGDFRTIFFKFFLVLTALALSMVLVIYFTGPWLFSLVFGDEWTKAGVFARYLCIFYAVRLIAGPLTFSFEITNKHYVNLIFQTMYLVSGAAAIIISYHFTQNDLYCVVAYSISLSILYLIHIFLAYINSAQRKHV